MPHTEPSDDQPYEKASAGAPVDDGRQAPAPPPPEPDADSGTPADAAERAPEEEPEPVLPEPVRQRIIALTAAAISALPHDQLPAPLRRVAKFAPNRRARLGGPVIASQLAADPVFRQRISGRVTADAAELGAAVATGTAPAAADPVEVAALAYLARPAGWRELIEASGAAVRAEADSAMIADLVRESEQRAARAEHDRSLARAEAGEAARRDEPGPRRERQAPRGGPAAEAVPAGSDRRAAAQRGAARHRTGPGDPGRRRPRRGAAPAAGPAGRGGGGDGRRPAERQGSALG